MDVTYNSGTQNSGSACTSCGGSKLEKFWKGEGYRLQDLTEFSSCLNSTLLAVSNLNLIYNYLCNSFLCLRMYEYLQIIKIIK